jgi:hypothetical protein
MFLIGWRGLGPELARLGGPDQRRTGPVLGFKQPRSPRARDGAFDPQATSAAGIHPASPRRLEWVDGRSLAELLVEPNHPSAPIAPPLVLPPNWRDVTAEKVGTVIGIVGATAAGKGTKPG